LANSESIKYPKVLLIKFRELSHDMTLCTSD